MAATIPIIFMVFLLVLGVPIAFALAGAGVLGLWLVTGDFNVVLGILGTSTFSSVSEYALTTIPMFILMAYFASSSGLARDLFQAGACWLSHIRGGLVAATVFACTIFGAMSGAAVASASVMSNIAMTNMRRLGYSEVLAAGAIAVGSTIDILIPPSVAMVVYGIATETSIGKLLIAGVIPGILVAICICLVVFVWVTINPSLAPKTQPASWAARWGSLLPIWPSLLLIFIVIGLLYSGIATPTEVGAIGALLAASIGMMLRRLTSSGALAAIKATIQTTAMISMILIGANIFGIYMAMSQVPQKIMMVITAWELNRWVVIGGIVVGYFVISMFMDEIPLLLLTLQLTFPLVTSLGFDPVWFGVISMMMISMGLIFPPVGLVAFVVSAAAKVDLLTVYKGTSVMTIALALATLLIMIFPQLALWLPARMK
jgi:C4-dicarboxylate transporter, DctM subunit